MSDEITKELAKFGITAQFTESKTIELRGRNGISCSYSARMFCPVVGFGFPAGYVSVRVRSDGVAEFVIQGKRFEYLRNDPARGMSVQ